MAISVDSILTSLRETEPPLRTPAMRKIANAAAKDVTKCGADVEFVFALCDALIDKDELADVARTVAFEVAYRHRALRAALNWRKLERLGRSLDGWASVDHFARKLSGPAWQRGQISDNRVLGWAKLTDFWWRRAGLVSTIALNERHLGRGDATRTLDICELFIDDRADLHVKALSWALRELGVRDPETVTDSLAPNRARLAPLVIREVKDKLSTDGSLDGEAIEDHQTADAFRSRDVTQYIPWWSQAEIDWSRRTRRSKRAYSTWDCDRAVSVNTSASPASSTI